MRKKRGQTTTVLVILVILTIATFLLLLLQEEDLFGFKSETEASLSVEDRNVRNFVQECLDLTAKNGIFYLGFVGGRLTPDPFGLYYVYDDFYKIPYFYVEGKNNIPLPYNEQFWTGLLDRFIYNYFEACINNFSQFPVTINPGQLQSATSLTDDSVIFNINFPVTVSRESYVVDLPSKYTTTVPSRLRPMLQVASIIVEKEVKNDNYIHWDYLTQISQRNYNITAYTEDDLTIIYRMIDLQNEIDDEPFILQFANKV